VDLVKVREVVQLAFQEQERDPSANAKMDILRNKIKIVPHVDLNAKNVQVLIIAKNAYQLIIY
jgi:hypothetical protein